MAFEDNQRRSFVAVGSVDDRRARIWFRAERPGRYVVEVTGPGRAAHGTVTTEIVAGNTTDNTTTLIYPDELGDGVPALSPLVRYDFKITSEDRSIFVGTGRFETAPARPADTPDIFSIGVVSCHQPFGSDGNVAPRNVRLLEQLPALFGAHDIKFLLTVGDQIYADSPGDFSLMNPHYLQTRWPDRGDLGTWTSDQIRQAYQERYRVWWNQIPWLKLLSSCPNYAILDDHEVFDRWGTSPAHERDPHKKIIAAARQAYMDYQGSRQLSWSGADPAPAALDYEFTYGTVATFVFDLRSERQVGPPARVVSRAQLDRFVAFLAANRNAHVILVVTSIPLVHIPEWVAAAGQWVLGTAVDFADQWSAEANLGDRNAVLAAIQAHLEVTPKQRLVVVGGDVHVGCAFVFKFVGGQKPLFYELTTSAVSNRLKDFDADISVLGPQAFGFTPRMAGGRLDVSLLPAARGGPARNPIGGLNAGIIECRRNGDETNLRLKLIGYGSDYVAREEFTSGWL